MEDRHLPSSRNPVHVNTQGAVIVDDDLQVAVLDHTSGGGGSASSSSRDSRDIYLPAHTEWISHVAIDIGGSLAKVVYFSRAPRDSSKGKGKGRATTATDVAETAAAAVPPASPYVNGIYTSRPASPGRTTPVPNGVLGPESIASAAGIKSYFESNPAGTPNGTGTKARKQHTNGERSSSIPTRMSHGRRRSSFTFANDSDSSSIPGGWLNFTKFETGDIASCIDFINMLIEASSASHGIPCAEFKARHVKIMATGGGAHLLYERLSEELGVEVRKEEEMQCLIAGLTFFMEIPHEVFWYSDELVHSISHPPPLPINGNEDLPRPSPNPPQYSLVFDENPAPQFPCMLVNIGSGVSIIKVDEYGKFERISGTSLGGGTLWGLLSMLTGADSFDEMLELSETGDNSSVDMLVGDIYGSDYSKIGLKSSTIASSFGKVWRKGNKGKSFKPEDIAKSLLYAISNNIGQIAYMNAEKHNLNHIYFGGCFIRGHAATISTLSYAIRFWSKGTKKALFLRHEGYLGAIGAWLRNIEEEDVRR